MLARFTNGRLHLLDGVVSDNSNFFLIEAFDGMKDEDFAVGAPKAGQRNLHELDQFLASRHLLGIVGMTVSDEVFLE